MGMGGKQPSTTTQTNKVELSPEQKQIFKLVLPDIQGYASQDLQVFPKSAVAGFDPLEVQGQAGAVKAGTAGQKLATDSAKLQNFLLDPSLLSPDSNPWLAKSGKAVADATTRNLMESILPQIRGGATVAGGQYSGGSTREALAEGLAVGRTSQTIADRLAEMYSDAYNTGLKTLTTAQTMTPQVQSSLLFGPSVASQVGTQKRTMEQAKLDEAASKFQLSQMLPLMKAQDIMGLFTSMPGGSGVSTVTGAQPKANPLMSGLGGAAAGAGLASTLFPAMAAAGPVGAGLGLLAALLMNR